MARKTISIEERKARAAELQATIEAQVAAFSNGHEWKKFLTFAGAFHQYSFNNLVLILSQRPSATRVAGFRKWQEKGRQVRKGETGIRIFGYSKKTLKDEDGNVEIDENGEIRKRIIFPVLSVFDIDQTDPIPGAEQVPDIAPLLQGADEAELWEPLTAWLAGQGWTVTKTHIPEVINQGRPNGYTKTDGTHQIIIEETLSPAAATKTLIHEAAHAILHENLTPGQYVDHRGLCETEAESVAYVVAGAFGMDTASYSIGYVTSWTSGDAEIIQASAKNVLSAAHKLIEGITRPEEEETEAA